MTTHLHLLLGLFMLLLAVLPVALARRAPRDRAGRAERLGAWAPGAVGASTIRRER